VERLTLVVPEWPAPPGLRAVATGRQGGVSAGPYGALNLGDHVGDDPARVAANRSLLRQALALPGEPFWLEQVHGTRVAVAGPGLHRPRGAAAVAGPGEREQVLAILTADCLPVLFTDTDGAHIGAAHAGWRGLAGGVLEDTVAALAERGAAPARLMAWLGPAIGPGSYEVDEAVWRAFRDADPAAESSFTPGRPGHWFLDLYAEARRRLALAGVPRVFGGGLCTFRDRARFFSHRRDGRDHGSCGRQVTLIWREGQG
jgi:YfiH family protein